MIPDKMFKDVAGKSNIEKRKRRKKEETETGQRDNGSHKEYEIKRRNKHQAYALLLFSFIPGNFNKIKQCSCPCWLFKSKIQK